MLIKKKLKYYMKFYNKLQNKFFLLVLKFNKNKFFFKNFHYFILKLIKWEIYVLLNKKNN